MPATNSRALPVLISVFFFWGFVAASNTILIGLFKKNFELTQFQSQLVDLAFYTAYFIGAFVYFMISYSKGDPLNKIGYKKGLIVGLIISAIGALGFIPAAYLQSFWVMLCSLFTIGLGFALQQIVANPYVIALGKPETGAHRISLAGGINSFGTTIGPLLLALAVYGNLSGSEKIIISSGDQQVELIGKIERTTNKTESVIGELYYNFGGDYFGTEYHFTNISEFSNDAAREESAKFYKSQIGYEELGERRGMILTHSNNDTLQATVSHLKNTFPDARVPIISVEYKNYEKVKAFISDENNKINGLEIHVKYLGVDTIILPSMILAVSFLLFAIILGISKLPAVTNSEKVAKDMGAFKYPQVILGMIAIFVYVGVEVTIQSNLPELMRDPEILGMEPNQTAHFISLYWGCLMIGRWIGALTVFGLTKRATQVFTVIVPMLAFSVIIGANFLSGSPLLDLLYFAPFILLLIAGFFISNGKPAKTMLVFGTMAAVMILIGMFSKGTFALYSLISGGLFCSVMWPCIFSLSIAGLGKYTAQASSLLVMMILGGALIPPFQGFIADSTKNIHLSYFIPVLCFGYLAFYGWKVKQVLRKQGIDYDSSNSSSH